MYCMKCGKETQSSHVFCDACLSAMAQRPVKADTVVQLPNRTVDSVKKAVPRRRQPTVEEQLLRLRRAVRWVSVALTGTVLALVITASFLVHTTRQQEPSQDIGKNYNTVHTSGHGD